MYTCIRLGLSTYVSTYLYLTGNLSNEAFVPLMKAESVHPNKYTYVIIRMHMQLYSAHACMCMYI